MSIIFEANNERNATFNEFNEYEYESDGDYSYESDGIEEIDEDYSDDDKSQYLAINVSANIPVNTIQFHWTALCIRLETQFQHECLYELSKDNLSIRFTYESRSFKLFVNHTTNVDLWFPYVPPSVEYTGSKIRIDDRLLITNNELLSKNEWNICTDIAEFVSNSLSLLREYDTETESSLNDIDSTIVEIVTKMSLTYRFESSDLPTFGSADRKKINTCGAFLGHNEKVGTYHSLATILNPHVDIIVENIESINPKEYYNVLSTIVSTIMEAKISTLEVAANEHFYENIIKIVDAFSLNVDVSSIRGDSIDAQDSEKVKFVDDFSHTFASNQTMVASKFVKRIFAEIDTIKETVADFNGYVLISEQNVQLLKLLLIPDYDTPYGGGYFEFDMYIPGDYPNSPPQMKFLTTGGGSVRFNPNLYNCGKVCLSVLNTWSTNQWNAKSSTISQVILSVHSMIFVEHPYTNEPCYYNALLTSEGRTGSDKYSRVVRNNCANVAIKAQLANATTPFKDVIQNHWNAHKQQTIEAYAKHGITIEE